MKSTKIYKIWCLLIEVHLLNEIHIYGAKTNYRNPMQATAKSKATM